MKRDSLFEEVDELELLLLGGMYALMLLDDILSMNIFEEFVIDSCPNFW